MPPLCNGTSLVSDCDESSNATQTKHSSSNSNQTVFGGLPSSTGSPGGDAKNSNDTTTDAPPPESTIWVPYLSLVCLVVVCVTLGFSFIRHLKRNKKRQSNVQDYIDLEIDLRRKRIFGMMRAPIDLHLMDSLPSSFDDSYNGHYPSLKSHLRMYNQLSDDHPPASIFRRNGQQDGGFRRYDTMAGAVPSTGIPDNTMFYHAHERQHIPREVLCEEKALCHHHCVASSQCCWKSLRNDLLGLFKDTLQESLRSKQETSLPNRYHDERDSREARKADYVVLERAPKTNGGLVSARISEVECNFYSNSSSSEGNKSVFSDKLEYGNLHSESVSPPKGLSGAIPKSARSGKKYDRKRRLTDTLRGRYADSQDQSGDSHKDLAHSDSELTDSGHQLSSESLSRLRDTKTANSEFSPPLSASYKYKLSHQDRIEHESSGVRRGSAPSFHVEDSHGPCSSPPPSCNNSYFPDSSTPRDPMPGGMTGNGGAFVNYAFQSDSSISIMDDTAPIETPRTDRLSERGKNHSSETRTSNGRGSRKKRSSLKSQKQAVEQQSVLPHWKDYNKKSSSHSNSVDDRRLVELSVLPQWRDLKRSSSKLTNNNGASRPWPGISNGRPNQRIDLSVIQMDDDSYPKHLSSADPMNFDYSFNDVNV